MGATAVDGLPDDLAAVFADLARLAEQLDAGIVWAKPVPVPVEYRDAAKDLWLLGLLTLNASPDAAGEYFSQCLLTPRAERSVAVITPEVPGGSLSVRVSLLAGGAHSLLLTASAGADLQRLPGGRSSRHVLEVRHAGTVSADHNAWAVHARLLLAHVDVLEVNGWNLDLEAVIADAALRPPSGPARACRCELEDRPHLVIDDTEPEQRDEDVSLVGERVLVSFRRSGSN